MNIAIYLISNGLFGDGIPNKLVNHFRQPGNVEYLRSLLSIRTPTIDAFVEEIFIQVIHAGHMKLVEIILKTGVNPNMESSLILTTPPIYASGKCNLKIVKLLLQHSANANAIPARRHLGRMAL